jgi:NAD(P)H-hydrate epimerase
VEVVTGAEMRELERIAIEEIGVPSVVLMENAALRVTERCIDALGKALDGDAKPQVLIVCGPGNNGGDGMAVARILINKGIGVSVVFTGDINAVKGDAAAYLGIIQKLGIRIETISPDGPFPDITSVFETCDLIVDAMLGTGLSRVVSGNYKRMIEMINERGARSGKRVISVDIPSGVHADTGRIMGCAVEAAETVTFAYPKAGLLACPGAGCAGKVYVEDISIPPALINRINVKAGTLADSEAGNLLPARKRRSNKGDYGRILVFAGSDEMPGAAALASSAAYMAGGGLVCACVLPKVAQVIHHWQREATTRIVAGENGQYCEKSLDSVTDELGKASVIIAGPGIGRGTGVTEFVRRLVSEARVPLVLDADALFALSEDVSALKTLQAPCVITPHPGEMSRLTGLAVSEILNDAVGTAVRFANNYNVITLLKDASTIIAQADGAYYINTSGNNALSKAGSGDVLCGVIAGLAAQHQDAFTAAALGAYIHGKAGEAASLQKSLYGVTATDVLENIPLVINKLCSLNMERRN